MVFHSKGWWWKSSCPLSKAEVCAKEFCPGDFPDLSLSSFSAYEQHLRGTVPKGSATQSGPFPKRSGEPPGLETSRFSFYQIVVEVLKIKNEKAAQRVSFGAGYPADVHADIPADVRGQKLRSSPRNPGKTSILARTSMTRRRGRPRP